MRDRQPTQPGRVKITPENGGEAFYAVMEMADEPTDLGTPPTKAYLLTDETAGFYGKDANATVNNVLAELGVYMQYWWRARSVEGHYEAVFGATETVSLTVGPGANDYTLSYSSSYEINQTTGEVALVNPTVIEKTYNEDVSATLRGKYFSTTRQPGKIFYAGSNAVFDSYYTQDDGVSFFSATLTNCSQITSKYVESIGDYYYLRSNDRNAYPFAGTVDGVEYTFLGKPLDSAVGAVGIVTGSYTGTGIDAQTKTITAGFKPKFAMIADSKFALYAQTGAGAAAVKHFVIWCEGVTEVVALDFTYEKTTFSQQETGLTFKSETRNFNAGTEYFYLLIG